MIRLKLYPSEFMGLVEYLTTQMALTLPLDALSRSIYDQILVEYWHKARILEKVPAWRRYTSRKQYSLPLPVSIGRILHQEMQHVELSIYSQAFLSRLDEYLTNEIFSNVYASRR